MQFEDHCGTPLSWKQVLQTLPHPARAPGWLMCLAPPPGPGWAPRRHTFPGRGRYCEEPFGGSLRARPKGILMLRGITIAAEQWLKKRVQDQPSCHQTLGSKGLSLLVKLKTLCYIQEQENRWGRACPWKQVRGFEMNLAATPWVSEVWIITTMFGATDSLKGERKKDF